MNIMWFPACVFFWLAIILRSFKLTAFFSLCDIWYFALFNFFGVIFTFEVAAIFSTQFTYSSNRGRLINASARVVVHTMPENNVPFCIKCHSQWIALFHCIVCLLPIWTFHIFLNQFHALYRGLIILMHGFLGTVYTIFERICKHFIKNNRLLFQCISTEF